jgi:hypothetical protein
MALGHGLPLRQYETGNDKHGQRRPDQETGGRTIRQGHACSSMFWFCRACARRNAPLIQIKPASWSQALLLNLKRRQTAREDEMRARLRH